MPETEAWTRCHVGSCNRHRDCMYSPCRAVGRTAEIERARSELPPLVGDRAAFLKEVVEICRPEDRIFLINALLAEVVREKQ